MIPFWIAAACLLAGALLFVLPPLLGRTGSRATLSRERINLAVFQDELRQLQADVDAGLIDPEQQQAARREIEQRVAEDVVDNNALVVTKARQPGLALLIGVALPVLGIATYLWVGSPESFNPAAQSTLEPGQPHAVTPQQIAERVEQLSARLKDKPDDVEGWVMLARSLSMLQRFGESAEAYRNATCLLPDHPDLLADYADILAMAQGRRLAGQPEALALRALAANPNHLKAMARSGSAAFERQDYKQAVARWQPILALVPADSEAARSIKNSIAEARRLGGLAEDAPVEQAAAVAVDAFVSGRVSLASQLAGRVSPNDTVFIFARAESGPPMPLAILRRQVRDLPLDFRLDDSMAMSPQMRLSRYPRVVVSARVSKSGGAMPASGDLQSAITPLALGGSADLVIDRVLP